MAPAISDNPTMNQFLRAMGIEVTQENLDRMAELLGKSKGSKTTKIPTDKLELVKALFVTQPTNGNGPTGDKPEEPKSAEERKTRVDPVAELNAWWETIAWKPKGAGAIIKRFDHRRVRDGKLIPKVKYRTATGKERIMPAKVHALRLERVEKESRGFPGYLLDADTEREGLDLLRKFPGCPSADTECTSCKGKLFGGERALDNHLRDILERILQGFDVVKHPRDIKFRKRHRECGALDAAVERKLSDRTVLLAQLASKGDKEQMRTQLQVFDEEACRVLSEQMSSFKRITAQQREHFTNLINDKFSPKEV